MLGLPPRKQMDQRGRGDQRQSAEQVEVEEAHGTPCRKGGPGLPLIMAWPGQSRQPSPVDQGNKTSWLWTRAAANRTMRTNGLDGASDRKLNWTPPACRAVAATTCPSASS